MEKLWDTFHSVCSPETLELATSKFWKTKELVITLWWPYKVVLVGTGAIVGLYWYATRNHDYFKKRGIPGPKPGVAGAYGDYKAMGILEFDKEVLQKYGKVIGIFHARSPVYLVADADMIKQIMVKEFGCFVNRQTSTFPVDPLFRNSILGVEDDYWKFHRSILSPTFTSGRMREMTPLIQKCCDTLSKNLWRLSGEGSKSVKMRDIFSMYTMDIIASTAFGIEIDCQADPDNAFLTNAKNLIKPGLRMWSIIVICSIFPFLTPVLEKMGVRTLDPSIAEFFVKTVTEAVKHRQKDNETRNDFLQLMLNSHKLEEDADVKSDSHIKFDKSKRRGLNGVELVGNALIFIIAGYETTSLALSYVAYNLATNPECQDRLIDEIDTGLKGKVPHYDSISRLTLLENVLLETLRLYPATFRTNRICNEDVTINGIHFPKGSEIHFPIMAIHMDPDYWPDPTKFDPDRFLPENRPENFNYIYLPFGAGPRNCIGMRLAHMEVKMAIATLLQKYRFKPAPETKIPPEFGKVDIKPLDDMVLMIEKR